MSRPNTFCIDDESDDESARLRLLPLADSQPTVALTFVRAIPCQSAESGVSLAATTAPLTLFAGERFDAGETARVVALMATVADVVFGLVLA